MAFDDTKDRLRERLMAVGGRIQESSLWNELMERYLDLNPALQKVVLTLVGFLAGVVILLLPWSFFSSSQDSMLSFEDKKQTIRDAYRVSRAVNQLPSHPPTLSQAELKNAIQGALASEKPILLPEQTVGLNEYENDKAVSTALPKGLTQKGIAVSLSRLNVVQIAKIGGRLQSLRPTAKVTGVKIEATAQDPHYFDVTYKVVVFNVPQPLAGKDTKPSGSKPGSPGERAAKGKGG